MSPPWSRPLDIDRLADGQADVDFAVPLAELPRLRSKLESVSGNVSGRVHFMRESGVPVAELTLNGTATLDCQRCLGSMSVAVESAVRVGLVATEADVSRVPEDLEPVLAPDGRISIGEIVEEELLLTLPIVPLHENLGECTVAPSAPLVAEDAPEGATQKPFERLSELLKRK
jgi:uncharacterized protein